MDMIWITSISTFPDLYRGVINGAFKGIAKQRLNFFIVTGGQFTINLGLIGILSFVFDFRVKGMLMAKLIYEFYCSIVGCSVMQFQDWNALV